MADYRWALIPGGICLFILLLIGSILFGCSFSILEPLEYGLEVNGTTKEVKDELYRSGRYFIGLGHYFERFPREEQAIVFLNKDGETAGITIADDPREEEAINSRTQEGMRNSIGLSIQYKIGNPDEEMSLKDQFKAIFRQHGTSWESFLVRIASESVRNTVSQFTAFDLFEKRKEVGEAILEGLKTVFEAYHFRCLNSVLLNVGIDDALQDAIQETEIVRQEIEEMEYYIEAKQIESDTSVIVAETTGDILYDTLQTNGLVYKTLKLAEAQATTSRLEIEKDALVSFKTNIEFTTEAQAAVESRDQEDITANNLVLGYFWVRNVENSKGDLRVQSDFPPQIPLNISSD